MLGLIWDVSSVLCLRHTEKNDEQLSVSVDIHQQLVNERHRMAQLTQPCSELKSLLPHGCEHHQTIGTIPRH
jgi:hypothetical protein